jgi:hypothetical protein
MFLYFIFKSDKHLILISVFEPKLRIKHNLAPSLPSRYLHCDPIEHLNLILLACPSLAMNYSRPQKFRTLFETL